MKIYPSSWHYKNKAIPTPKYLKNESLIFFLLVT